MKPPYLQRRYLVSFSSHRLPHIFTDVLVIGGGAAGLRSAIEAANHGQVIVLSKGPKLESNTYYAQGGMAAVIDPADSLEDHIDDTLRTGIEINDKKIVEQCIRSAPQCVEELRDWGVQFDTDGDNLRLGREGGHNASRIVHALGDATGRAIEENLFAKAEATPDIKIFDECFALDLLTDPPEGGGDARCVGAITYHPKHGMQIIQAKVVILAAGGAGMIWRETSNPSGATGDAIAMVFRAGGQLGDMEMMQFHPTTLYIAGSTRSLVSEAVRGEGAYLVNRNGERFMPDYHEMAELAPRDVVSRAILDYMGKTGTNKVYLDVRKIGAKRFAKRFPSIFQKCCDFDIDLDTELIPVHPAAHYMIGGAWVDSCGRTSIAGLLACGEAACTGLHGANRLASNSLTEALVYGKITGQTAAEELEKTGGKFTPRAIDWTVEHSTRTELDLSDIRNSLRSVMWRNTGIVRDAQHLTETLEIIEFWGRYVLDKEFFNDPRGWEIQNMLTAAWVIVQGAILRTETRGVHHRKDYPETDPNWARHLLMTRTPAELIVE
ncbi:MAG: L-aspartate oxidase [Phycisphaerae bacterium]|nr:L-aspartate oxidase [Phycisphaerae bacterium]